MLLGYSFGLRPNSRALGTAGSVMTIFDLLINRCTYSKNQLEESKQDWLVQTFGLRRRRRLADAIQAECPFLPLDQEEQKGSGDRVTLHPLQSMFDLTLTAPDQWRYKSDRPWHRGLHHLLFSNNVTGFFAPPSPPHPLHLKRTDEGDKANYSSPTPNGVIITASMTSACDVLMSVDTQDCTMS